MKTFNIIIAGGGTGGHIYPALAIAKAVQASAPEAQVHFVGSHQGLESQLVPREGFPLHLISVGKLNRNVPLGERLKTLVLLPWAFIKAIFLLIRLRPRAILGVGGYASAPVLFIGALLRFPTMIWEPNALPGMANRLLSRWVGESFVVYEAAQKSLRTKRHHVTGMPIRKEIEAAAPSRAETASPRPLNILIFGGSQGARGINNVIAETLAAGGEWLKDFRFVHQTGPHDYQRISELYRQTQPPVEVHEYLHDMDRRYQWADLVICRAGTGTISELAATGLPAVFVPLPTAADNHQQKNAEILVRDGAARMILQKDFTPDSLRHTLDTFRSQPQALKEMAERIRRFYRPNAAETIAELILTRARENS